MPFTLKVEFAGLCLHLEEKDRKRVGVLMPDCRKVLGNNLVHEDRTTGVPHVGYLRFDLANLIDSFPAGSQASPRCEVVYRFNHQHLDFNLPPTGNPIGGTIELPRLEEIANEQPGNSSGKAVPLIEPLPDLFSLNPGEAPVLMRTILTGGVIEPVSEVDKEFWKFPQVLRPGATSVYKDDFRSVTAWTRRVEDADVLTLSLANFDGRDRVVIRLKPTVEGGVIPLKIANLCADNPLEWDEFNPRLVSGNDVDFKWLFRLVKPTKQRKYRDLLKGADGKLQEFPVPERDQGGGLGRQDCFGAVMMVETLE
jgi:hypothetical protein